jgi:hypothetical protein
MNQTQPAFTDLNARELLTADEVSDISAEVSTEVLAGRGLSDSNLWESMAEIKQTIDMIRNPFDVFRRVMNRVTARSTGLTFAELWLMYRYGILPLIKDVDQIMAAAGKQRGKIRKTTRARLEFTKTDSVLTIHGQLSPLLIGIRTQTTDTIKCRGMSLDEFDASLAYHQGFSAKGLVTLPWELVSYSFVADWFFNVGSFLNAMVPAFGYNQLGACLTLERTRSTVYNAESTSVATSLQNTWDLIRPISGYVVSVNKGKSRGQLSGPALVVRNNFKLDQVTRLADAFALAGQQLLNIFGEKPKSRRIKRLTVTF